MSWKYFFFLHVSSIRIFQFLLLWRLVSELPTVMLFSFPCPKRKSVVLNSLKSCWCLQAQWWKAKSLLDRWNLPSGYVSSMESNCWASESFLSVDPLEILLSVRREKMMKTSKCWPKEVFRFFFFVVLRFFLETIFLQTTLTRSWWWNVASNLIAVVKTEIEFHSSAELNAWRGKILPSVKSWTNFSKCRPQELSSMMRGKRCFFFSKCQFGEFSKSHDARKKNVDGSKFMRQMF